MEEGPALDALIAEKVMGWSVGTEDSPVGRGNGFPTINDAFKGESYEIPAYSADISAAWEVVEKINQESYLRKIEFVKTDDKDKGTYYITFGDSADGRAATAPMAICLAALKAVGYERP